ncbi:DUF6470 family protein [Alteribacillus iranensis]|uniref:Uncharacterized protein n=1 Tax=Alteribacillus iranensis TaxID=930128 RepID=A0A1I2EJ52_9BACI|nr:DUF6470 family protein [Alteribacillus iranensis]SFE92779.1 hypothetical protein SAMN05192532_10638 [Alteribacillus iranensis]
MELAKVSVMTESAKLGFRISTPSLTIKQPQADLQIHQDADTIEISTDAVKVFIDQTDAREDAGLVPVLKNAASFYQNGMRSAQEYISKQMKEAEILKTIENNAGGGKGLTRLASKGSVLFQHDTVLGFIPEHAFKVSFHVQKGDVTLQTERKEPTIHVRKNEPEIHVPRWDVSYDVRQRASIEFHVGGEFFNKRI